MMSFAFDLISDLHLSRSDELDWHNLATSQFCAVAGDVSRDRNVLVSFLERLAQCYRAVFYIDGNDDHKDWGDLDTSYDDLVQRISRIDNVVYLQDNVVIMNDVALLAANGWWTYDFGSQVTPDSVMLSCAESYGAGTFADDPHRVISQSCSDLLYLEHGIQRLQRHVDVKHIVIITHTVPRSDLVDHDAVLRQQWQYNVMGNNRLHQIRTLDTEHKIKTWCFGHYHGSVDQVRDGVRFVNNCRGRDVDHALPYYPKRIEIT